MNEEKIVCGFSKEELELLMDSLVKDDEVDLAFKVNKGNQKLNIIGELQKAIDNRNESSKNENNTQRDETPVR